MHWKTPLVVVVEHVRYLFDPALVLPGAVLGATTTFSMGSAATRWIVPGYFLGALLAMSTLELFSCYFVTARPKRREFPWEPKITGKLLVVFLVLVSLLLDGVLYFGAQTLPPDFLPLLRRGLLPITMSSLTWLIIAEAARTVHNVSRNPAEVSIPPMILWFIRQWRKEDEANYPGEQLPNTRRIDHLTEDDVRHMLERGRDDPDDPPPLRVEA